MAVVPHPPLLVPELAAGAAAETAPLRNACLAAARALARGCPRWIAAASCTNRAELPSLAPAYRGELLYSAVLYGAAPYGAAYHVALWDAVPPENRP